MNWPPQFNDVLDESALCAKEEYLTHEQRKAMEEEKENDNQDKEDKGNLSSSSNGNKKRKRKRVSQSWIASTNIAKWNNSTRVTRGTAINARSMFGHGSNSIYIAPLPY